MSGNVLDGNDEITKDNHQGVVADHLDSCLLSSPISVADIPIETAEEAFLNVLAKAGASKNRDVVDERVILEAKNGTAEYGVRSDGIIDSQNQVGGWPELQTYGVKTDSDNDGMPDQWEKEKGLDPDNGEDHAENTLHDHFTNIEVYLNEIIEF